MSSASIDVAAIRGEQRTIWNSVAGPWQRWAPQFERGAGVVTRRLIELGGVTAGQRVLDVGTGVGEPARTAAGVVGPGGSVLAIDPAPEMIAAAQRAGADRHNLHFAVGDVETATLPLGAFDVVLSRWALMFAADRVATLRRVAGLLRPGGVLAAAVWGPPPSVPMISLGFAVISRQLALDPPPPGGPGPFSMADPTQAAEELRAAGFVEVAVEECVVPFVLDSVDEFVTFTRDVLPPRMRQLLTDRCGAVDDPQIWAAVRAEAERFVTADGTVSLPSVSLCLRAVAEGGPA
ncbi:class I SAM-dependent methyltransferase [Micromonospora sp. CPCC 206060]|uniref:class I SAM-dependent methyltransferase n=1 Tax=Micromonospora sp. CPCC 206060 TaxID=3122406 RepID=UPI002FEEFF1F